MSNYAKPILIVVGPTGIGKSDFSISIAKDINAEIIITIDGINYLLL